jgi:hemolysin III
MQNGEKFNTISHLLGAFVALPGMLLLIVLASQTGDPWKIVSTSIYGFTLVLLYMLSSLYHGHGGRFKKHFQKLDHLSIYLLIAGTYTPYMLVTLRGAWGWSILGVVWGLAVIGMIIDLIPKNPDKKDNRIIQLIIYLIMVLRRNMHHVCRLMKM